MTQVMKKNTTKTLHCTKALRNYKHEDPDEVRNEFLKYG